MEMNTVVEPVLPGIHVAQREVFTPVSNVNIQHREESRISGDIAVPEDLMLDRLPLPHVR